MGTPTQGAVIAVGALFDGLAIIALAVRIYSNRKYQRSIEIDDMLLLPAFLLTITAGVAMMVGGELGFIGGHSLPMITPEQNSKVAKFEYAFWIGHVVTQCFIKLSILFLFRRLFMGRADRTLFDIVNWTLISAVIGWTLAFAFADGFACGLTPQATWTSEFWMENVCIDTSALMVACSSINWIIDLAILFEPLIMILNLHLSLRGRLQLCTIFLLSGLAVIAGLIRMVNWIGVYNHGMLKVTLVGNTLSTGDIQAVATMGVFWTEIEIGVGFLVACLLPTSKVLDALSLSPLLHKLRSITSSIWTGSRRSNSTKGFSIDQKDIEASSESSWSVKKEKRYPDMKHYDRELSFINGMPSTMNTSGDHQYLGTYTTIKSGETMHNQA